MEQIAKSPDQKKEPVIPNLSLYQRNPTKRERGAAGRRILRHKTYLPYSSRVGHVPLVDRLVERGVRKHTPHILHVGNVPLVERLVEGFCIFKHRFHIRHVGHVPLIERLVERFCAPKHTFHW